MRFDAVGRPSTLPANPKSPIAEGLPGNCTSETPRAKRRSPKRGKKENYRRTLCNFLGIMADYSNVSVSRILSAIVSITRDCRLIIIDEVRGETRKSRSSFRSDSSRAIQAALASRVSLDHAVNNQRELALCRYEFTVTRLELDSKSITA